MKNAIRLPAIALAALLPLSAVAERGGIDGMDSKRRLDRMQEELHYYGLTLTSLGQLREESLARR